MPPRVVSLTGWPFRLAGQVLGLQYEGVIQLLGMDSRGLVMTKAAEIDAVR